MVGAYALAQLWVVAMQIPWVGDRSIGPVRDLHGHHSKGCPAADLSRGHNQLDFFLLPKLSDVAGCAPSPNPTPTPPNLMT